MHLPFDIPPFWQRGSLVASDDDALAIAALNEIWWMVLSVAQQPTYPAHVFASVVNECVSARSPDVVAQPMAAAAQSIQHHHSPHNCHYHCSRRRRGVWRAHNHAAGGGNVPGSLSRYTEPPFSRKSNALV